MLCTFLNRGSNVFLPHVFLQQTIDLSVKEGENCCWYLLSYEHIFLLKCSNLLLVLSLKVLASVLENNILKWL